MNIQKTFSRIVKANANGKDVTVVTDYDNAKDLLKYVLSIPDTSVASIELSAPEWHGYDDAYLLSINSDGTVYCEEAVLESGAIAKGEGLYLIDVLAIGENLPEDFVLDTENTQIKLID